VRAHIGVRVHASHTADFRGGRRYQLVGDAQGINSTYNPSIGVWTAQDNYACGFECLQYIGRECRAFSYNSYTKACTLFALPIDYMPYNYLMAAANTRSYAVIDAAMPL
jgi:hypothetical protein